MQCSESSEWMSLHLDGLLDQEQAQLLREHLAQCDTCAEEWKALRWLSSTLKAEPMATPAPDFTSRVVLHIKQYEARRCRLYSSLGVVLGSVGLWAIAGAALLSIFIMLWQPLIRLVIFGAGLPLLNDALSILALLGKALWSAIYALSTRPTWMLMLGYFALTLTLVSLWARIVIRRWSTVRKS